MYKVEQNQGYYFLSSQKVKKKKKAPGSKCFESSNLYLSQKRTIHLL